MTTRPPHRQRGAPDRRAITPASPTREDRTTPGPRPRPDARRLRAALARLLRAGRQAQSDPAGASTDPGEAAQDSPRLNAVQPAGPPAPESAWEHAAEYRLARIERKLADQNRLLLFTFVSIMADLLIGFTR